jgi:hypothetical protein
MPEAFSTCSAKIEPNPALDQDSTPGPPKPPIRPGNAVFPKIRRFFHSLTVYGLAMWRIFSTKVQ